LPARPRLVPPAQILALALRFDPDPLFVVDVAEEFDVDWIKARRACARLGSGTSKPPGPILNPIAM
jgi:hypothetical protein